MSALTKIVIGIIIRIIIHIIIFITINILIRTIRSGTEVKGQACGWRF